MRVRTSTATPSSPNQPNRRATIKLLPGLAACIAVALAATLLGGLIPLLGAPVCAILLGVGIATWKPLPALEPGAAFASKAILQWSIVLLGAQLNLAQIVRGGTSALPVMLGTFAIVLALAYVAGRILGIDRDLRRLLAIGTGICGGSAIAALASVIDVDRSDVAYALGVVFFFNIVAVVTFPFLGHLQHLSQAAFGLWAGTAINDTSSVVAAAFAYGTAAGSTAIVVKLTRTLLIVPMVLFYAWKTIAARGGRGIAWSRIVPWFVLWFLAAAALNTFGAIPPALHAPLQRVALFTIVVALAGVGLGSDPERIKAAGLRPLLLGAILWIAIAASSLAIAHYTNESM
ncbi:MAG: putative sulfate exporter family transporter [Candidatus Eremiobacteraeota bacterium]|nr:putative sulfate exporter family transporter [Candidatus Eremiobacteraeota bacterium]MBV8435651.1 putative sulfate exporter family transporter [Candidatus Eremiobacteraeota bacterium]